jgi:hypothetical protein
MISTPDGFLGWTLLALEMAESAAALTEAEASDLASSHRATLRVWFDEGHLPDVAGLALALVHFDGYAQSAILDALAIIGSGGVVCRLPQVAAA